MQCHDLFILELTHGCHSKLLISITIICTVKQHLFAILFAIKQFFWSENNRGSSRLHLAATSSTATQEKIRALVQLYGAHTGRLSVRRWWLSSLEGKSASLKRLTRPPTPEWPLASSNSDHWLGRYTFWRLGETDGGVKWEGVEVFCWDAWDSSHVQDDILADQIGRKCQNGHQHGGRRQQHCSVWSPGRCGGTERQ